jgi:hypothetical protein
LTNIQQSARPHRVVKSPRGSTLLNPHPSKHPFVPEGISRSSSSALRTACRFPVKLAIAAAAVVEAAGLLTFLLLMDFLDRLHWLLLVTAFLIYGTLAIGIIALGAYVNLATQRVLKAISLQGSSAHE